MNRGGLHPFFGSFASAAGNRSDSAKGLGRVSKAMQARYRGADLGSLQNAAAPGVDKRKICAMTVELYREVLKLPVVDSGKVLRFMMGGIK